MTGFILLLPFSAVRFVWMGTLSRQALRRAARYAPLCGKKTAGCIYRLSNAGILLYPMFLTIHADGSGWFAAGVVGYLAGLALCTAAVVHFSAPDRQGLNTNGIYGLSRNPMYLGYFVCFTGIALQTQSAILFGMILLFQISAHRIILSEERWCTERFGTAYREYMQRVRRYL